jgi:DNA-binding MarR family transcriptional regulator
MRRATLDKADSRATDALEPVMLRDLRDAPAHQLGELARLSRRKAQAEFSAKFGVNLGEWTLLATIFVHAPATLAELSQVTMLDKGQLSRTVQRLVQRGWVASRRSPNHRGALQLSLTQPGHEMHATLLRFAARRNALMMATLTPAEQDCFLTCIRKLRAHFQDQDATTDAGATTAAIHDR